MNPLREAAGVLTEGNWVQGASREDDKYCAIGALTKVVPNHRLSSESATLVNKAINTLGEVIKEQYPSRFSRSESLVRIVIGFNDHHNTGREDVVAMMEKAATRWDEKI